MSENSDVPLDLIAEDDATQLRAIGYDPDTVGDYAEAMRAGTAFPPVILYYDGEQYFTADGWHRIAGKRTAGGETITAVIHEGGKRDAILYAASANATHGLRRTQADKRNAVLTLLRDPEWAKWSDRKIGKTCAVDHKTVGKIRRELTETKVGKSPPAVPAKFQVGKSPPGKPIAERIIETLSDDALQAECERRGWEVRRV